MSDMSDDFTADRHEDLTPGEAGGAMTADEYYRRIAAGERAAYAHLGTFAEGSRVIASDGTVTITGTVNGPRQGGEDSIGGAYITIAGTCVIATPDGPVLRDVTASMITVAKLLNGFTVTALPATCPECNGTGTDAEQSSKRTIRLTCRDCGHAGVYPVMP